MFDDKIYLHAEIAQSPREIHHHAFDTAIAETGYVNTDSVHGVWSGVQARGVESREGASRAE